MASVPEAEVVDAPDASRYELRLDGELIGVAVYRRRLDRIVFVHTEVAEAHESHGFAGLLASNALDDARRRGLAVVPLCPYIAAYIDRHPEYQSLVPDAYLHRAVA
jgi:predicted GNAT family acetyltransferase